VTRQPARVGAVDDAGTALDVYGESDYDLRTGRFGVDLGEPEGWGDETDWVERHSW
jgi:hypothetical protein